MIRFAVAILASLTGLVVRGDVGLAADPSPYGRSVPGYGRVQPGQGRSMVGGEVALARPRWSYYGEYQYPVPFGYGYAYAPVVRPGFEYGYYGPRYSWSGAGLVLRSGIRLFRMVSLPPAGR